MFLRIYPGRDGKSHFEELPVPAGPSGRGPAQAAGSISFTVQAPGTVVDFHTVPERSYYITLPGQAQITCGDEVRTVGPGDMTLCEDLTGQGHRTAVVGNQPRVFARITLGA